MLKIFTTKLKKDILYIGKLLKIGEKSEHSSKYFKQTEGIQEEK